MRNMIDVNKSAFLNLKEQLARYSNLQVADGKRYIYSKDYEKDWIKIAEIKEVLPITPDIRLIQFKFQECDYVALIGSVIDNSNFDSSVIDETEKNAGIVTLLISKGLLKLNKQMNYLEFYNNILFQYQDSEYIGNDYHELLDYLEPIQIYLLPENSIIKSNILNRTASYIFSKNPSELILDFKIDVTELISELSIMGSDSISYKLILSCLFSTTYKHAFLELYRLIERLFPISYLKEFHEKSASKLSFLDFVSELETITSWRPKEDEAIEKIFKDIKTTTQKYFENFLNSSQELKDKNISQFFYSLRNSIVHFRANHSEPELTSEQWNLLILATLYLMDEIYSFNTKVLN